MKWNDVRNIYPNQFVKFEILKSNIEDGKEFIDEVAVIESVSDDEATKELLNAKDKILVYHTSKDSIILKLRTRMKHREIKRVLQFVCTEL